MAPPLTIAFFGLPLAALSLIRDGHSIAFAVLSPVEAPGRRRLARQSSGELVDALTCDAVALERRVNRLWDGHPADLLVSWFWTRRLPDQWLARARLGGIGCHPSLLPRHRGPDPYFWTIDSGDELAGVTVHRLDKDYDTGRILAQSAIPVGDRDSWQLARALDRPSLALLRTMVGRFAAGEAIEEREQDPSLATLAPHPRGAQLRVDWHWPTARVLLRLRALAPMPGLAVEVQGVLCRIVKARATACRVAALLPGEAFVDRRVAIQTADGAVEIEQAWVATLDDERLVSGEELAGLVSACRAVVS